MYRKKLTALLTAAMILLCAVCGGLLPQTVSAAADKTVYITAESVSGAPGSSVPFTIDIRSEQWVLIMGLSLFYDSALSPVPADPAEPSVPKAKVDLRDSDYAEPTDNLVDLSIRPEKRYLHIASDCGFRWGRVTVWFDIPADAAAGTQYPLNLQADVLHGSNYLNAPYSLTNGTITVTEQSAETTPAEPVKAAFDITEDTLQLTVDTSGEVYEIAYTASENLDYIEWQPDTKQICVSPSGYIYFNFPDDANYVIGAVTATAHFLDGTVLTDTVSIYARDRRILIDVPDIIGDPEIDILITEPVTAETTTAAKASTTTARAATTTAPATTRTVKATTATAKVTTATAKATTTTAKATAATAKVTTTTAKAATTTAKAATTTAKAATTTAKAATTTAKAATTTAKAATTTAKAATTTAKAATTTAKATTTTAKVTTTTAKATTATNTATTAAVTSESGTETTPAQITTTAPTEPEILTGDVNGDGEVTVEDAQLTLKAYTKRIAGLDMGLTERQIQAANVNGDAELSVDDAQFILRYYTEKVVAGKDITWEAILRTCGKNLRWTLDEDGTLTISGTGRMTDWEYNDKCTVPWISEKLTHKIKKVVIKDGVTSIGDYAFGKCQALSSVTIPESVTHIGEAAFHSCSALTSVTVLNETCIIDSGLTPTFSDAVIRGYAGSTAESYAKKNGNKFEAIP